MRKILSLVCACFLVSGVCFAEEVVDKALAIVNGEPLMSSEFNKIVEPMVQQYMAMSPVAEQSDAKLNELKNQILEQKIEQMILTQEAKKQKIKVVKRELDEAVNQVKKRFGNDETFQAELKKEGLTPIQFEKRIAKFILSAIKMQHLRKEKLPKAELQVLKKNWLQVQVFRQHPKNIPKILYLNKEKVIWVL